MKLSFSRTGILLVLLAGVFLAAAPGGEHVHSNLGMSLYEQLGGVYGLAPLVEDFVDRLWDNKVVNANPNFQDAKKRYAKASLRFLMTEYLCRATDGPCDYRGRNLKTAHASLGITEKEWQAMLGDLRQSMGKFGVPAALQEDLVVLIEGTKKDIVAGAAAKPAAPHEHH